MRIHIRFSLKQKNSPVRFINNVGVTSGTREPREQSSLSLQLRRNTSRRLEENQLAGTKHNFLRGGNNNAPVTADLGSAISTVSDQSHVVRQKSTKVSNNQGNNRLFHLFS
ncbi:hypothetical protein F2P81_012199 [Scophthalmus maximus]|uniref:Uncharacterized protein n=1 Tax=Scophthalmus maximus TaxID=52904 RepID=A0A6A4STT0_SCOMX|nr:hypothetical protein F2P81_012199 [Scophthalmus maximus]